MRNPICTFIAFSTILIVNMGSLTVAQDKNIFLDSKDIKLEQIPLHSKYMETSAEIKAYGEDWWAIDIKFSTEAEITKEIKVKVYLAADDYFKEIEGQDAYVILTGEVTFINVLEGSGHRATFYLHPGSARRYSGKDGTRSFGKTSAENYVYVEISENGRLVAEMGMDDKAPVNWHRDGAPVPDVLLSVEKSPWWPFDSRAYNQVKEGR
jgi:hypothetical protein